MLTVGMTNFLIADPMFHSRNGLFKISPFIMVSGFSDMYTDVVKPPVECPIRMTSSMPSSRITDNAESISAKYSFISRTWNFCFPVIWNVHIYVNLWHRKSSKNP